MSAHLCFVQHRLSCNGLGSSGDSLDRLIQGMMARVSSELDSASSPLHSQAFTLMIWVRLFSVADPGSEKKMFVFSNTNYAQTSWSPEYLKQSR